MTLLERVRQREDYIDRIGGASKVEFSYLLDMFRDERKDVRAMLEALEEMKTLLRNIE